MKNIGELFQSADWQKEKHVPFIEVTESVKAGTPVTLRVQVGKLAAHPNTTEHHIRWIAVYFHAEGDKFPYELGRFDFTAHGESTDGPNNGSVFTDPDISLSFKTRKAGTIFAVSLCNIHGLWQASREIGIQ
jgi:superoxide reductase